MIPSEVQRWVMIYVGLRLCKWYDVIKEKKEWTYVPGHHLEEFSSRRQRKWIWGEDGQVKTNDFKYTVKIV